MTAVKDLFPELLAEFSEEMSRYAITPEDPVFSALTDFKLMYSSVCNFTIASTDSEEKDPEFINDLVTELFIAASLRGGNKSAMLPLKLMEAYVDKMSVSSKKLIGKEITRCVCTSQGPVKDAILYQDATFLLEYSPFFNSTVLEASQYNSIQRVFREFQPTFQEEMLEFIEDYKATFAVDGNCPFVLESIEYPERFLER